MKSRKTRILVALGLVAIGSFSLMAVSAAVTTKTIKTDLSNAIQRIPRIQIKSTNYEKSSELRNLDDLLRIDTESNGFVLGDGSSEALNLSTILGGRGSFARARYDTIIGGDNNAIHGSDAATILGGISNKVNNSSHYSVVAGGNENVLNKVSNAVIVGSKNKIDGNGLGDGGSNDVIIGNNSKITNGSNSVALGQTSTIEGASSSFLWTDSAHTGSLRASNTFAVVADNGMVVNKTQAHNFAKLTIGGSLTIVDSSKNPVCGGGKGKGILKVVENKSNTSLSCFCSCDGEDGWSSLFGAGMCSSSCNSSVEPICDNTKVDKFCTPSGFTYSGYCEVGDVVSGTGAYLVEDNEFVNWACQTNNGVIASCGTDNIIEHGDCRHSPDYTCIGEYAHATQLSDLAVGLTYTDRLTSKLFNTRAEAVAAGAKCAWVCDEGWHVEGTKCAQYDGCTATSSFKRNSIFPRFVGFTVPSLGHGEGTGVYVEQRVDGGVRKCSGRVSCHNGHLDLDSNNGCPLTTNCPAKTVGNYSFPLIEVEHYATGYNTGYVYSDGSKGKTRNSNTEGYYNCEHNGFCNNGNTELAEGESCTYGCYAVTKNGYNVPGLPNGMTRTVVGVDSNKSEIISGDRVVGYRICDGSFRCDNGQVTFLGEVNCRDEIDACPPQTVDEYTTAEAIAHEGNGYAHKQIEGVGGCDKAAYCSYGIISLRGQPICNLMCVGNNPQGEGVVKGDPNYQDEGHTPQEWTYRATGPLGACEWRCDSTHEIDGNGCKAKTTYTTCKDNPPEPTGEGVLKGDSTYAAQYTQKQWTYKSSGPLGACDWTCDSEHEKDGNGCKDKPVNGCDGPCGSVSHGGSLTCYQPGVKCSSTSTKAGSEGPRTCTNGSWNSNFTHSNYTDSTPNLASEDCEGFTVLGGDRDPHGEYESCTKYVQNGSNNSCKANGTVYKFKQCEDNYELVNGICKAKTTYTTCGGDTPNLGSEGLIAGASTYTAQYTQKQWTYKLSEPLGACEWTCDSDHEKDGNGCRPKSPCSGPCGGASNGGSLTCYQPGVKCVDTSTHAASEGPKTCTDGRWNSNFTHSSYTDSTPNLASEDCEGYTVSEGARIYNAIYDECIKYTQNGSSNSCKENGKVYKFVRCEDGYEFDNGLCQEIHHECGDALNTCGGGEEAWDTGDPVDDEYSWKCGTETSYIECVRCTDGTTVPEHPGQGECKKQPLNYDNYCPDTCPYNANVTDVTPTCLNGATVVGNGLALWDGTRANRSCENSQGGRQNCSISCPRCTGTTEAHTVINVNHNAPSLDKLFSYSANTNDACTYRCENGYSRVYNSYTKKYECKDVDHYEWRFYAPDDTSYSNPLSSISWTISDLYGKFEERAEIYGTYMSFYDASTEFDQHNDTSSTYIETDSDGNDSGGETEYTNSYTNPYSHLTYGKCEHWNVNDWEWNRNGENYVSNLMWNYYSLYNVGDKDKKVTINLSKMATGIPIMEGVYHPGYTLSSSFRLNWIVASYRRIDLTFNSSQPSVYPYYASAGVTRDIFGYMIWGVVRKSTYKRHEACVYAIEPVAWEHIKAVSEPVYYARCGNEVHGAEKYEEDWISCVKEKYQCNDGTRVDLGSAGRISGCDPTPPPSCFLAGTPVLTQDGSKNIEDIQVGDIVLSYNTDTNSYEYQPVVEKYVHEDSDDEIYELTIDGNKLEVTYAHKFYVKVDDDGYQCVVPYKWEAASELKTGDQLLMADGTYTTVENITHRPNHSTTYNFKVDNNHNYFVGEGYLVHNAKQQPANPYEDALH